MSCVPLATNAFNGPCGGLSEQACRAKAACELDGASCRATDAWRCAHPYDICDTLARDACMAHKDCGWSPFPVVDAASCAPPDMPVRNGCVRVPTGDAAFADGDVVQIMPRAVRCVRTGRIAPLANGDVPCCATLGPDAPCDGATPCRRSTGFDVPAPAGCSAADMCVTLHMPPSIGGVVDLRSHATPAAPYQFVNTGIVAGSSVCYWTSRVRVYERLQERESVAHEAYARAFAAEGWYYGEVVAVGTDAHGWPTARVLRAVDAELEEVTADRLYVLGEEWARVLGPVRLPSGAALRLGDRVSVPDGAGGTLLGVAIAFNGRAGAATRALCPAAVERVTVASDTEELREVALAHVATVHDASVDVRVLGSTAHAHFEADARLRLARFTGLSEVAVDFDFLALNCNRTPDEWLDVRESARDRGVLNDADGRIVRATDMHTHTCFFDDTGQPAPRFHDTPDKRAARMQSVAARLPVGYELRWPAGGCLQARRPRALHDEALARGCCWESARRRASCAADPLCRAPCVRAADGTCGYELAEVHGQSCAGVECPPEAARDACAGAGVGSAACAALAPELPPAERAAVGEEAVERCTEGDTAACAAAGTFVQDAAVAAGVDDAVAALLAGAAADALAAAEEGAEEGGEDDAPAPGVRLRERLQYITLVASAVVAAVAATAAGMELVGYPLALVFVVLAALAAAAVHEETVLSRLLPG